MRQRIAAIVAVWAARSAWAVLGALAAPSLPAAPGTQKHVASLALNGMLRADVPVASIKTLRERATVRQRYDFSCGSAAVATLLTHHYGQPVNEQQAFEAMYAHGDQAAIRRAGFSLLDIQRFLAARGLRADGFQQPLQALLDAAVPAIVLINDNGYRHFVVIKGGANGRVLLGDPARGTRAISRAAFDAIWVGRLLFLIHGYSGPVRFNHPEDWRAAPLPPLAEGIDRASLAQRTLPGHGPGDF